MYADRYAPRSINPGSLSLSVGIVGGLIAAAMLSTTVIEVIKREKPPLTTYTVPPPDTPPPPADTPRPELQTRPQPTPTVVDPIVIRSTEPTTTFTAQPDPGPPAATFGTTEGTGAAVVDPPKPPPPVLVRADVDPRYARDFQPIYPPSEQRAGSEGVVSLRVLIGVDGRVRQVERLSSPSDDFWRVTEQRALSKWRFTPATRDGVPYESWKTMTVRFKLNA